MNGWRRLFTATQLLTQVYNPAHKGDKIKVSSFSQFILRIPQEKNRAPTRFFSRYDGRVKPNDFLALKNCCITTDSRPTLVWQNKLMFTISRLMGLEIPELVIIKFGYNYELKKIQYK